MRYFDPKKKSVILRALRASGRPLGGTRLARELEAFGLNLQPRTLRLYLQELQREGFVEKAGHRGRVITPHGIQELKKTSVIRRIGFTAARVDALAYRTSFRLASQSGHVVANVSLINKSEFRSAVHLMEPAFRKGLGMGHHCAVARAGETLGEIEVPPEKIAFATLCSVTLSGILLGIGIPVTARFGGVLELDDGEPTGFSEVIHYDGTSLDPLEVFIKGGLTNVTEAARTGRGRIGASFREVPSDAVPEIEALTRRLDRIGMNGVIMLGRRNQPLLDFPVHEGRTGMIVAGGLNPLSMVEEAGIPCENHAMCCLLDFERFRPFDEDVAAVAS
jgi:repressor of nif and glnA expression